MPRLSAQPTVGAAQSLTERRHRRRIAAALLIGLAVLYNSNGRELGTVDSQPAKFTAQEIAAHATLQLDRVIAEKPGLSERPAFAVDRQGHTRSAYPIMPALLAAGPAWLLGATGAIDLGAPLASNAIAAFTASLATAGAVALVFVALGRMVSWRVALLTALGLGLGTNYWPLVSRTLWSHETVALGIAATVWAWLRATEDVRRVHLWIGGVGLAIAGAARPQLAPMVAVLWGWLVARSGARRAMVPAAIVATTAVAQVLLNYTWFGSLLGATSRLESLHPAVHAVSGVLSATPWTGALGLLVSPSRGLFVFSPIALIAVVGSAWAWSARPELGLRWLVVAALAQFATYACYSVWWGGHTYGPRYLIDVFVPLMPAAALAVSRLGRSRRAAVVASVLLAWSVFVAGLGAFVYPNEQWNTSPDDVDRDHARLWSLHDSQIERAFHGHASPQNFDLLEPGALHVKH